MELEKFKADIYNAGAPWNKDWEARIKKVWEKTLKTNKAPVAEVPCSNVLSGVWISVKTRLPDAGEIVLWWNDDVRMIEFGSAGSFNGENVTYWMPLPEQPQAR